MVEFLVITGLSGAGRSSVADAVDDLGWFVIDNVPLPLFSKIAELTQGLGEPFDRVAFVLGTGARGGERPGALVDAMTTLRTVGDLRVVFVDAADEVLVQRYEETRRRHPQPTGGSLLDAIRIERSGLEPVRAAADVVIDTTQMNLHQLRAHVASLITADAGAGLQLRVSSFGYKRGVPVDMDLILDCRFLPNPHWDPELRSLSGLDEKVREFVLGQPGTERFLDQLTEMLGDLLPAYAKEGRSFLGIAFGCTGGRHRSVAIAEEFAQRLRKLGYDAPVTHRDIDR
ncbi:MAG TPA: RNase adapter RapZ [Acidimicrobiales bacterium]|nr:RNase adapter RapZ [Acidimicrobiales bacterium]